MIMRISVILLFLLSIALSSSAEIYKYRDASGVMRFTNNLQEVPKDQREKVDTFHEIETKAEVEDPAGSSAKTTGSDTDQQAEALRNEKELLDSEYAKLEEDRTSLVELSQTDKSAEEDAEFRKQVESYNVRIKAYEEKRNALEEKIGQFNAQMK